MLKLLLALLLTTLAGTGPQAGYTQARNERPDMKLTPEIRKNVIEGALKEIRRSYVFPETAARMEAAVRNRLEAGEYDKITSAEKLATTLTEDLRAVSHDRHLSVDYFPRPIPEPQAGGPTPEQQERRRAFARAVNYGFKRVERLDGNVGYLSFEGFMPPEVAGDTAAAAMGFLANTSALIIDLRENHGGDPAMVAMMCSYLFPSEPVHLNDIHDRPGNSVQQYWTLPYLPGQRYVGKPVYLLTSKQTFSAAEEFCYNLQNLKRATLVGEITGGGAHPSNGHRIHAHFGVAVPYARAVNPVTGTNWEGVGVKPDVVVPADLALKTAHVAALKRIAAENPGMDEEAKAALRRAQEAAEKDLEAAKGQATPK